MNKLAGLLDRVTMYKVIAWGLMAVLLWAIVVSALGILHMPVLGIVLSALILGVVCFITNKAFAVLWQAQENTESWLITALILSFILPPTLSFHNLALVALAGIIAMASKYIVAVRFRHIFNPAAFAAIVLSVTGLLPAIWWVGSPSMFVIVVLFALAIMLKLRRYWLTGTFVLVSLLVTIVIGLTQHQAIGDIFYTALFSGPLIFLGFVMLTEPETAPSSRLNQIIYAAIVGTLFMSQLNFGWISATPEAALIIGNLFVFAVERRFKMKLRLQSLNKLSSSIYELRFQAPRSVSFVPGQYLEWTLPHAGTDVRGNRRSFSVASSPDDDQVSLITKAYVPGSSYKKALFGLRPGAFVTVGNVAGEFTLPADTAVKLGFIAGGIGITPFLSMIKTMIHRNETRDIVLFYLISKSEEYLFQDIWKQAEAVGVTVYPILGDETDGTWTGLKGRLTADVLKEKAPDFAVRRFYVSGPNMLVRLMKMMLHQLQVRAIVTDYFSGY